MVYQKKDVAGDASQSTAAKTEKDPANPFSMNVNATVFVPKEEAKKPKAPAEKKEKTKAAE